MITNWLRGRKKEPSSGEEIISDEEIVDVQGLSSDEEIIDVRRLMAERSVEDLCETAEAYFSRTNQEEWKFWLSKPFHVPDEVPHYMVRFSALVQGLRLGPGMSVLDFGAGTCWASRLLAQLNCRVVATDVSATALRIGQELFACQPLLADQPEPRFLPFDGRRIDLPDNSVDRVFCFDAFHHVPNPDQVLAEIGRVLVKGGIAGFAEPGPGHSRSARAQAEMRNFTVVENDILIEEVWDWAQQAGFTDISLTVFNLPMFQLTLPEFQDFLAGGPQGKGYVEATRNHMQECRLFFLYKGPFQLDSRRAEGLSAQLEVTLASSTTASPSAVASSAAVAQGQSLTARFTATNTGTALWLAEPSRASGLVQLGCQLLDEHGTMQEQDYLRRPLSDNGKPVLPGETRTGEFTVLAPSQPGRYTLSFDLVSERVRWFAPEKSTAVKIPIEVC